jgi:hypothetical protein
VKLVDEDDLRKVEVIDSIGRKQQAWAVDEPGLYQLLLGSNVEKAKPFRKWVTAEVLPTIRKTGSYSTLSYQPSSLTPVSREFKAALSLAKAIGFVGNQAILSANKAIRKLQGVDCLELLEATHLIADSQEALLTSTEVGQRLGVSRNQINPMLEKAGLLKGYRDHKNRQQWELTEIGKIYGLYQGTGKANSDGTPIRQIKWNASLIGQLQKALTLPLIEAPKTH